MTAAADHSVHGMGTALEPPAWPPITEEEADRILRRLPGAGRLRRLAWHSPRPFSAATLAETDREPIFLKRHATALRNSHSLAPEHRFIAHLRRAFLPVPDLLRADNGETFIRDGAYLWEFHTQAAGLDLYRDRQSWTPFLSPAHAHEAGRMLARLHDAAAGFTDPPRPGAPLLSSLTVLVAPDPTNAAAALIDASPPTAAYLHGTPWRADLARLFAHHDAPRLAQDLAAEPPLWTHGDWHPSNLLWTATNEVAAVIDFGLADRTCALYDLAIALERTAVRWLELDSAPHQAIAEPEAAAALLAGYAAQRPLSPTQRSLLARLLPLAHVEFALSELVYFCAILDRPEDAARAWRDYLFGHAAWFDTSEGRALLALVAGAPASPAQPRHATPSSPLVTPAFLASNPDALILDATVDLAPPRFDGDHRAQSGLAGFRDAHIQGARHLDLLADFSAPGPRHFMHLDAATFCTRLGALGATPGRPIVAYDRADGFWAARLWYEALAAGLAIHVLDGGLTAWRNAGHPIAHGDPPPPHPNPPLAPTAPTPAHAWATLETVRNAIAQPGASRLVCALSCPVFEGTAPTRYARRGAIPGSVNLPARTLTAADGTMRPASELDAIFASALGPESGRDKPLLLYCGAGISASYLALGLAIAGRNSVSLYDGSLEEWSADPTLPLVTTA